MNNIFSKTYLKINQKTIPVGLGSYSGWIPCRNNLTSNTDSSYHVNSFCSQNTSSLLHPSSQCTSTCTSCCCRCLSGLSCPNHVPWMHWQQLGKPGQAWGCSPFAECQCAMTAMQELFCHTPWLIHTPFLSLNKQASAYRAGDTKQASFLLPASLLCYPVNPPVCCVNFLAFFPTATSKPVSNLDEDHLFKSTKHNLEYMEYGQRIYSLLLSNCTSFLFITLVYSWCFKETSPCCYLQMKVHSAARCLDRCRLSEFFHWMPLSSPVARPSEHTH